jgi:hypothetical protein
MKEIGAKDFKTLFKRGIENLIKDRKQLNDINVYPVPDGDTGDNLACTVLPVYEQIDRFSEERIDTLTAQLSSHMLLSARGNSGVIFSQFFSGFSKAVKGEESLDPAKFAAAMHKATEDTYLSLESPKEGTILTVIRHTAEEFGKGAAEENMFPSIFNRVRQRSRQMLEKTRYMLPQLKKAGVIDAGGLGFYLFFEGMANFFRDKKERLYELTDRYFHPAKKIDRKSGHAYCAQWTLRSERTEKDFFKERLKPYAESIVVADSGNLFNIHLHTDSPDRIEAELRNHGEILSRKIDDLNSQMTRIGENTCAIVIDSTVDIPETIERQNDFTVVPIWITIGGESFRDKVTLGRDEFYRRIQDDKTQSLKTSQPAPAEFKMVFETVLRQSPNVLSFTLSSRLSGTHQSAAMGIRQLPPAEQQRILLIDTKNTSAGSGLLVLRALELLQAGKTHREIGDLIKAAAEQVLSLGYVETLDYAVRGGRAPRSIGLLARILGIKALVKFEDGVLKKAGVLLRSRDKEKKVVRKFIRRLNRAKEYAIGIAYTDNPDVTDALFGELEKSGIRIKYIYKVQAGAALGAHAGPGTFCLWALPES